MIFYCRSYCLLNMFRAPLCPSSGAREYYTGGCCLWYLVFRFSRVFKGYVSGLRAAARKPDTWPSAPHHTDNLKTKAPNTTGNNHLYNTLELLMVGIVVPETYWASNKISNKKSSVASSWHFISTYYDAFYLWFVRNLSSSQIKQCYMLVWLGNNGFERMKRRAVA